MDLAGMMSVVYSTQFQETRADVSSVTMAALSRQAAARVLKDVAGFRDRWYVPRSVCDPIVGCGRCAGRLPYPNGDLGWLEH